MGGFSIGNYALSASLPLEVRDWQDFLSLWDTFTIFQSGKLLIFFCKGKTKNVMLVQSVEHRDALDYLRFTVLLANLNEFLFRRRRKHNSTKVNKVLIGSVFKNKTNKKNQGNGKWSAPWFFLILAKVMNCPQVYNKKEYVQWFFIAVSSESKNTRSVAALLARRGKSLNEF